MRVLGRLFKKSPWYKKAKTPLTHFGRKNHNGKNCSHKVTEKNKFFPESVWGNEKKKLSTQQRVTYKASFWFYHGKATPTICRFSVTSLGKWDPRKKHPQGQKRRHTRRANQEAEGSLRYGLQGRPLLHSNWVALIKDRDPLTDGWDTGIMNMATTKKASSPGGYCCLRKESAVAHLQRPFFQWEKVCFTAVVTFLYIIRKLGGILLIS